MLEKCKLKFACIVLYCSICFLSSFSQQNLFNVPSSEITAKKKVFFQEQLNIGGGILQSNTNFCYGLGNGFEVGMNFIGLQTDYKSILANETLGEGSISPLNLISAQKGFHLSQHTTLGIGLELGTNLFSSQAKNKFLANYSYANIHQVLFDEKLKLIGGGYYANAAYQGQSSGFGFQVGYEYSLSKKIHLVGDWLTGNNSIGLAVIGGMYYLTKDIPLSLGFQIPNSRELNSYGLVFEFTYVPN